MTPSSNPPASDPSCTYLAWTATTRDAWWVFDAPSSGRITLDFCPSNYDTSVVLYQGSCGALTRIGCDDDSCQPGGPIYQSRIVAMPVSAGPVYIRVGGYGGATGVAQFTLSFSRAGDECSTALPARLGLNDSIDTSTMTASANAPASGECQFLNWLPTAKDAWWVYDAPNAGLLSLHFCASNFDTSVVVYQGNCGSLTRIACDDDGCAPSGPIYQSKIDGLAVAAGPVFIRVAGYGGSAGIARFTLDFSSEGRMVGWGSNSDGQSNFPASLGTVTAISGGSSHTAVRKWDGTAACWGYNYYGQCNVPSSLGTVAAISAGLSHTVALKPSGSVVCWGGNASGECNVPSSLGRVTAIGAGGGHTVALKWNGTVVCWGYNFYGQCNVPGFLGTVAAVAAGGYHTSAVRADGTVACWGRNFEGQCDVPSSLGTVATIALGRDHSVALKPNGTVACWGRNYEGQCNVPSSVGTVRAIAAGGFHTVALRPDGSVVCWGSNGFGQNNVPASVASATTIAGGEGHTLAVVPASCMTDLDGDASTDAADLSGLLAAWGTANTSFDLDGDGLVGAGDLSAVLSSWGQCAVAYPSPRIVSPNFGPPAGGTRITISGTNLTAATSVKIGGVSASNLVVLSPTSITAVTPPGALGTRNVTVTISGIDFILPSAFTYTTVPSWATVLEAAPSALAVPSALLRDGIVATGYPWRVRDNATGIEMLLIPPGTFNMGCSVSSGSGCFRWENPVHTVTLTNAFYLGRYEVTQAQWTARMGSNPAHFQEGGLWVPPAEVPNRPIESVSWNMVAGAGGFLSGTGLRLPTEAEWEYA
ncbi:MAG: SUMF1/EgtB/PvdO family nonheme iron enzyme, partial [bacterium]